MTAALYDRPIDQGVEILVDGATIEGDWSVPMHPKGTIILVNGTGNSRLTRHNREVARYLYDARFATLLLELLTRDEEVENELTGAFHLAIPLFTERLLAASHWVKDGETGHLPLGYLAGGVASAAAVVASVREPGLVRAIASRGGRPDLAGIDLHKTCAPILLIVGSADHRLFELNRWALRRLNGEAKIAMVPGATPSFEEGDAQETMCRLAARWFESHMPSRAPFSVTQSMFSTAWAPGRPEAFR